MNDSISIVLADDHPVICQGIRAIIEAESDLSIVGEASDGLEAIELVAALKPDIIVSDVIMPGLNGLDLIKEVAHASPKTRVVLLSMHASEPSVLTALHQGASAYVLKDAPSFELIRAIREVSAGRRYLSPPLSLAALQSYLWQQTGLFYMRN